MPRFLHMSGHVFVVYHYCPSLSHAAELVRQNLAYMYSVLLICVHVHVQVPIYSVLLILYVHVHSSLP